jgi:peptidoglycan/xylan/chitin deacetylase (PgdA/CDA1 family)
MTSRVESLISPLVRDSKIVRIQGKPADPKLNLVVTGCYQHDASVFGSHTHSRISLSSAPEREAEDEMRRSKKLIEDRLGPPTWHFAYPFAAGAECAARRLFGTAAVDAWRTKRRGSSDPHRLGRTLILRSDGRMFFRAKVQAVLEPRAGTGPWRRP